MTESLRFQDMEAEKSLAEFMDDYLYSRMHAKDGGPLRFTRMQDKESQLKGIDVCIETGGRKIFIDEKSSLYYSNAMIPTFAFELDSIQRGHSEPVEGWFINDALMTEYYMLIWPNVKCENKQSAWVRKDIGNLRKDDFTIVEAMLIQKVELRNRIESIGYTRDRLLEYAKRLRKLYEGDNGQKEEKINDEVKFMYSGRLAEKPINLVVRKEVLKESAKKIYLISQDGYATIKE
ncbi:hypothetical protein [Butyrivibrio sp. AE3004]|uniref:hypothetical protein n=1 Tax=Butyrivibrio sp. AE3004 TaxID=1506994 RepID=UPI000690827E|nr:hypothetical protein [Butyrivibrio sp. AE3004]